MLTSAELSEVRTKAWLADLIEQAEDFAREGIPLERALWAVRRGYERQGVSSDR